MSDHKMVGCEIISNFRAEKSKLVLEEKNLPRQDKRRQNWFSAGNIKHILGSKLLTKMTLKQRTLTSQQ